MMMKKIYISARHWITVFVLFAFTPMAFAQQKAKQIDDLMRRYADNGKFNGSVLVAEGEKVIFKKGYGLADMEWAIPNTPDTKFRLGSLTKQFTALLIMQLVEQGKLKPEGKIPTIPKRPATKLPFTICLPIPPAFPIIPVFLPLMKSIAAIDTNLPTSLNNRK
jgi:CubicO group peptidase (beta-lactamase class C family)